MRAFSGSHGERPRQRFITEILFTRRLVGRRTSRLGGVSVSTADHIRFGRNASTASAIRPINRLSLYKACYEKTAAHICQARAPRTAFVPCRSSQLPLAPTMATDSERPKGRDGVVSSLNVTIEALNLAKEISGIAPAKTAFGSVSALLTMIRVHFFGFRDNEHRVHIHPGLDDQRTGVRRART